MTYFSMFSGIGGFELGIERVLGNQARCIGYSEIDKHAINTYERHFNDHRNYGNATTVDARLLPATDLIVGGFPCQAFSVAGKRLGFGETRGTLFFDIARILKDKRPGHLVLENVRGLLSHDAGKTFQTILGVLTDLGYDMEWQLLNSKDFGVPQNRERVYIVGHIRGGCRRKVFPLTGNVRQNPVPRSTAAPRTQAIATRHLGRNGGLLSELASTVQVSETPHVVDQARIRRLTPKECERLQGFPDDWTLGSDTQRYKQCGNAVTVNVVEAVINKLSQCLLAEQRIAA